MTYPAISLHQPWATLCALGVKRFETRSWPCPAKHIGQRIAIHAAKKPPSSAAAADVGDWQTQPDGVGGWSTRHRPTSAMAGHGQNLLSTLYPAEVGQRYGYRVLPLGAVVATAVITASLPIVDGEGWHTHDGEHRVFTDINGLWRTNPMGWGPAVDILDQDPYGDWTPGRWAWALADVEPLTEPVPWKGRQGFFEVNLP